MEYTIELHPLDIKCHKVTIQGSQYPTRRPTFFIKIYEPFRFKMYQTQHLNFKKKILPFFCVEIVITTFIFPSKGGNLRHKC